MASLIRCLPRVCIAFGLLALTQVASAQAPAKMDAGKTKAPMLLSEAELNPVQLLPAPPAHDSALERQQLAEVRAIGLGADPERIKQAKWDNDNEDPTLFDSTIGAGFQVKKMPATWKLLTLVQSESDTAANYAKRYFKRLRPWAVDATQPRRCEQGGSPDRSYPSGHSMLGYSVGMIYAQLLPAKASAIQNRARDYAFSRMICGEHFVSDTEASHALAAVVATKLMANPQFQAKYEKARAELVAAHIE